MEITSKIAKYVVDTRYEDLPETTREIVKKDLLDTLASAVAGTMDPICKNVADLVKEWGGKPESTVLVYGGRIPSLNAALINSVAAHILDLTDAHEGSASRAGVTIVPAAFAVTEAMGVTNGTDLIAAVAIGLDLVCRMSLAASAGLGGSGFLLSSMTGVFGAAATTAKLLGLDQDQTVSALGIAYSQAAGNMQAYDDKAFVTRLQNGFAAKAGILSGLLAQRGVSGTRNVFSGRYGLYEIYEKGKCDLRQVTDELGERFECDNLSFKPYPSMRSTHAPIDAALDIVPAIPHRSGCRKEECHHRALFCRSATGYNCRQDRFQGGPCRRSQSGRRPFSDGSRRGGNKASRRTNLHKASVFSQRWTGESDECLRDRRKIPAVQRLRLHADSISTPGTGNRDVRGNGEGRRRGRDHAITRAAVMLVSTVNSYSGGLSSAW